ncbi:flagellar hook-basal body complex protein FliE [Halanaerobium sp. Z-7514]|uniref:Flagellar hook-basal body complex protein FliE n=1 Tax=Halanaerobium polyolivorans TaxID=2886943 RepID=A0AAW4X0A0_9FIRM|nr:flagellar hook-basal body complex protein FliE [Halanaerobium polyolivorans]MCC3145211.1 flagellar hook-basal body complex protein FliE [Halanaerobium polyolivorans]
MNNINPVQFQNNFFNLKQSQSEAPESSFREMFRDQLMQVNQLEQEAQTITADFAAGKVDNIHDVTIAGEKANLAVNLSTAVQSKVLSAYEEIMRLQV